MKLFLTSEAKHPDSMAKLDKFVGGLAGKSIAYIPTAANGEGWECWKSGSTWALVQLLGADLSLVQLEDHRTEDVKELIAGKDIVWVAGGMSGYLLYWMHRTKLNVNLRPILESGTIYVGSSAGSMITATDQELSEWYIGETEPGAAHIPGLGLVDFNVYPHYQDELYDQIKAKYTGNKMYLLKDGEAITVEDDKVNVLGEKRIIH